jgi:2,4'-dihydroxyacetophenone dioxygenase
MSITTPANPADAVRLVTIDDAPWADTGTGVLLKVVRYDSNHGTWVILNRFKPGVQLQTHRHTGSVDAYTSAGRWHYLEYDFYILPGSYLYEPANSVHTLHVPDDNTEDTDVCFIIEGALLNLAEDGSVESVSDGPGTLEAYYALLEAQGDPLPQELATPAACSTRRCIRAATPSRCTPSCGERRPCAGSTTNGAASGPSRHIPRSRTSAPTQGASAPPKGS